MRTAVWVTQSRWEKALQVGTKPAPIEEPSLPILDADQKWVLPLFDPHTKQPQNREKTSSDGDSLLMVNSFPIDKSQNSQWRSGRQKFLDGRWKRIANSIIVSVIVYFIIIIVVNLYRQCCQPLSQSEVEKIILDSPTPEYLRSQSFTYTSGAHLAGKNQTQATYTRDLWESYGIQTKIEEYEVLLNYPLSHRLALFSNDSLQYEATSANPDQVPTFHGYILPMGMSPESLSMLISGVSTISASSRRWESTCQAKL